MQGLEKIPEEIDVKIAGSMGRKREGLLEADEIIRKHMSDGWIPVEERLPEESGYYLVQLSKKLPNEDYSDRVVVLYGREDKDFMTYSSLIVAWQPIPEPYRPERNGE